MKPAKEKAKELVETYYSLNINYIYQDTQDGDCVGDGNMTYKSAKQCALKAIAEQIYLLAEINNIEHFNISKYANYLQEVKQEIENL